MEIFINSIRNVFFGLIVLVINVPIFWSFSGFIKLIKDAVIYLGIGA